MGYLCGILGRNDGAAAAAMAAALSHRGASHRTLEGPGYAVAGSDVAETPPCLVDGAPRDPDDRAVTPAGMARLVSGRGPETPVRRGHFACAWQGNDGAWRLMRDRFGAKPLYYCVIGDCLLFASGLKALLATGQVPRRLHLPSVDEYMAVRCALNPHSLVAGVCRVTPGHVLTFSDGQAREEQAAGFDMSVAQVTRGDAALHLRDLLENAAHRAGADSLLWSAGIDSAALGAVHAVPRTLSVNLDPSWQNEARQARESAARMGVDCVQVPARRLSQEVFRQVVAALDEPVADASPLPLWLLFDRAARHGTTFMSGHGADELLGGYSRYHMMERAHGAKALVPAALVGSMLPALPPNAFVRRAGRFLRSIHDRREAYLSMLSVFDRGERDDLYTEAMKAAVGPGEADTMLGGFFTGESLTRDTLELDLRLTLPNLLLAQWDRLSAANGVDLRLPYLDDDLADFAVSLPQDVRFGVRGKPLLRAAFSGHVPGRTRLRMRRAFSVPQEGPAVRVIDALTREILTQDRVEDSGLFKWRQVALVVRSGTHNIYRRRQFWALLMFFAWYREVMEG